MQTGFDNSKYVQKQTEQIKKRIERVGDKLYLEFGGKLFDDYHAARVLPGFAYDAKIRLLCEFKDICEILFCINATDIEKSKVRADLGLTYDLELLRLIDSMRELNLKVDNVVITQYNGQPAVDKFRNKLERHGIHTYLHYPIKGYPTNVNLIVSDDGYGKNEYIPTSRPLVVVTAPGPCSGKMATCLSQLYHENKRGVKAGYAKFETFPIWNIPLKHPVNLAYEAATADHNDVNMIDPYHLESYGELTVNYNRDIEIFPVVKTILNRILGEDVYKSPTDMGVNMAGYAICDNDIVCKAAKDEIIRRYYRIKADYVQGLVDSDTVDKISIIMQQAELMPEDRGVVKAALDKRAQSGKQAIAIELPNGAIVTGRDTDLMIATASSLLNALKKLADLPDELLLISPEVLKPIIDLKESLNGKKDLVLNIEEILIALSICAGSDENAAKALAQLEKLRNLEAHSTTILPTTDEHLLKKIGLNLTVEPSFASNYLYNGN